MKTNTGTTALELLLTLSIMFIFAIAILGCGQKISVSGGTTHRVEGTATIKLAVDFSICDSLPEADKADCIEKLLEILAKAEEGQAK